MATAPTAEPVAVILGGHPFPHGNASANRMLTLAQTWQAAGWRVLVVNDDPGASGRARVGTTDVESIRGVDYVNLQMPGASAWQRSVRRRSFGDRAAATLVGLGVGASLEYVVVPSLFLTPRLRRSLATSFSSASIVADVVERHDAAQFPRGHMNRHFLRHRLTSWYAGRFADRVIAISSALAEGPLVRRTTLVLPPCIDTEEISATTERRYAKTRITYFGSPGSKDDLASLLRGLALVNADLKPRILVSIAGLTLDQLRRLPGVTDDDVDEVLDVIEVLGPLSRRQLLGLLRESHYSFLLRDPSAGFARYGFPSKVPESLAAGCPPITNLTSDLATYLVDGVNALVCRGQSPEEVALALTRAVVEVEQGRFAELSGRARRTAEDAFDTRVWAPRLRSWLTA